MWGLKAGILLILALAIWKPAEGRSVEINVKAPWPVWPSSSIVQASEFISDFSADSFWQFAEGLCEAGTSQRIDALLGAGATADATAELQSLVYDAAAMVLPSTMHHIMDTSLGLNAYAPAAQFYHSLLDGSSPNACGPEAKAFALLYPGGQTLCSAADVAALRASGYAATCPAGAEGSEGECALAGPADGEQSSWDHVHPGPGAAAGAAAVHLVLYGTVGEGLFCAMHAAAKAGAAESPRLRYSARHAFLSQAQSSRETTLQGYGVFLDIKNMEYNTADTGKEEGKKGAEGEDEATRDPLAGVQEGVDEHGLFFSTLLARRPADKRELGMLREEVAKAAQEGHAKAGKMKVWKIKDLGLQTVQAIVASPDPAAQFAQYVHSFPSHATELSSLRLRSGLVDSLQAWASAGMAQYLPHNALLVNGLRLDLAGSTFNVFDLLASLCRELMQQARLQSLGLSAERQRGLVQAAAAISGGRAAGGAAGPESAAEGIIRIDVSKGGKHVVAFLNNLEKDVAYKRWPKALRQLLMPSWSLHSIARNLYTLIFVLDPLSLDGISLLLQLQAMHAQQYPVRFGAVLVCDDPAAAAGALEGAAASSARRSDVCRLFSAARKAHGDEAAFAFLGTLAALVSEELQASMMNLSRTDGGMEMDVDPSSLPFPDIPRSRLAAIYADTLAEVAPASASDHQAAAQDALVSEEHAQFSSNCSQYLSERGLRPNSFSLNGIVKEGAEIQGVMQLLGREQYILAQYARKKLITDKTRSIFSAVLALGRAYPRYHPMLEAADLSFADALAGSGGLQRILAAEPFLESSSAACPPGSCTERACNTTIVVVPVSAAGLRSALAATQWLRGPEAACSHRLALGFCAGAAARTGEDSAEARVAGAAALLQAEMGRAALEAVHALLAAAVEGTDPLAALARAELGASAALQAKVGEILGGKTAALDAADRAGRALLDAFGLPSACDDERPSAQLSYNARRVSVALEGPSSSLHEADLSLLAGLEWQRAGQHLRPLLAGEDGVAGASDLLLRLSSFAGEYGQGSKRHDVHGLLDEAGFTSSGDSSAPAATAPFMFRVPASAAASASAQEGADEAAPAVQVYCIVDPLSIAGQRAAAVLPLLSHSLQLPVTVVLVPRAELSDFPLQNFYRQVLLPHSAAPKAVFSSLPLQHTLTARPDAPEPWNIQTSAAEEDTDNLRSTSEGCPPALVSYVLKNVLLAGQCFQTAGPSGQAQQPTPPKGLQLTVSPYDEARGLAGPAYADTLVMQNLGYFQLQANPGLWRLDVAQKATFSLQPGAAGGARVVAVRTFTDVVHRVFVRRDHDEPALAPPAAQKAGSMWDSLSSVGGSLFGSSGSKAAAAQANKAETIHVFSLATGHMYERLLRIMMLSVSKRASLRVKFWLFENFLSPAFKAVAAAMAQEWGFEVAYVTYKWPTWLTQQTEKQRIIWGYKILFLDVLFPLDVKKIIYVDADQVVRADLKELWEHDLQGKPYGYVPFCTSRQETLGFQFWRSGYWADHLRGKPYHISALYVVDLHRFREYSVGDQLRAVYDGLARDPNSLANLDQDLPNYAQHSVPIHSLPQEWLWCETWCADKSKEAAKTIDLCNNPLHKEPKLDMARRVISGHLFNESWVQLDEEIKALQARRGLDTRE